MSISTGFAHAMYLDSVRLGERDITMDEFEIAPGLVPFRVLLKTGSGRVSGTFHDGVGGIIVLVPKDERLLPEFMAVPLFSSGRFQVENVHPGDYYACFVMGRNHAGWGRELIRDAVHYIERLGMTHRDSVRALSATNEIRPNAAPRRPSPGRELL